MEEIDLNEKIYVWCWSHGDVHVFFVGNAWCGAMWERLQGNTVEEALRDKIVRFGTKQFDEIVGSPAHMRYLHEVSLAENYWEKELREIWGPDFPEATLLGFKNKYVNQVRSNPRAMLELHQMEARRDLTSDYPPYSLDT